MSDVIVASALGLLALLVVGVVLHRASSRRKKEAIESLAAERDALASPSILDLVNEEVEDLGLRSISGAEDVPPDQLLRAWNDADASMRAMDRSALRFVPVPGEDTDGSEPGGIRLETVPSAADRPSDDGSPAMEADEANDA